MDKILAKVLKKVVPAKAELEKEQKFAKKIMEKIVAMKGTHESVELVGSIARNTHLRGDNDLDIFVFFPKKVPREEFEREGLRIGKAVFRGHEWEKAYSEHPYIRGRISGYNVEIVPSYRLVDASLLKSAVDRSSFHNAYVKQNLGKGQENEVRLLKQFMKGVKCYGADLSASGFPGYVAELLVLRYGSFRECIKTVSEWRNGEVIDVEAQYSEGEAMKKFDSHLIVVDPVDSKRNVAAALSINQYARFVAACRAFVKKPSINFFFPKKHRAWSAKKLREFLKKTELVAVKIGYPKGVVEDIMWGQVRRLSRKISSLAKESDFIVTRTGEWLENKKMAIMLLEVESTKLQKSKIEIGPEVSDTRNSEAFLKAHARPLSGPRIRQGRWVLEVERKHQKLEKFLEETLRKMKKQEKEGMRKALNKHASIMNEKDIIGLYRKNKEFRQFLTSYLKGKEEFLDY